MSVELVSEYHVNAIIGWAENCPSWDDIQDAADGRTPVQIARQMVAINLVSAIIVNGQKPEFARVIEFTYRKINPKLSPVQVIKACDCFDSNANAVPEYGDSLVAYFVAATRVAAIKLLPGYSEAAWFLREPKDLH